MDISKDITAIELFKEDLADNVKAISVNIHKQPAENQRFIENLCQFYEDHDYLSNKQIAYMTAAWQYLNSL